MTIQEDDEFSLEFTGSSTNILVSTSPQLLGEIPVSASITISRLA